MPNYTGITLESKKEFLFRHMDEFKECIRVGAHDVAQIHRTPQATALAKLAKAELGYSPKTTNQDVFMSIVNVWNTLPRKSDRRMAAERRSPPYEK